ncbi:hypothetical protein FBEOM_12642 [Fusarium beomiforme]|uniref:Uncharacterized protein n=1 Tax=Fusarium beomiforme TaxID=44412 RepID=A0A9P5A773_9HYPO|nr:hypothetical protein FBEOM_12642 [Fusarium beomiforme]
MEGTNKNAGTTKNEPKEEQEGPAQPLSKEDQLKLIHQYYDENEPVTQHFLETNFVTTMSYEEGIKRVFCMYIALSDKELEQALKASPNVVKDHQNLVDIVAKRYKQLHPLTLRQPHVGMFFVKWLKAIKPMVLSSLPDLDKDDAMKKLLREMRLKWDEVAEETGCFKKSYWD